MARLLNRLRRRARQRLRWPDGSPAALSLSFDDARPSQVSRGLEVLDRLDVRAIFFVLPEVVRSDIQGWRAIVERGHEIGNHSLRHRYSANVGVSHKNSLERLTLADIESDIDEASRQLEDPLGTKPRVFAYPCGQTFVGRGVNTQSYVPVIARKFLVGRTFNDVWGNGPLGCDLAQVAAINSDAIPTNQLREPFEDAHADGSWIVLGGHEIGGAGRQTTFPETIEAVVRWCRGEGVWIGTVGAIGETVEHMPRGGVTQAGPRSIPPAPSMRP